MLTTHDSIQETIEQWLDKIQVDEESIIRRRSTSPEAISQNKVWKESHLVGREKEILEEMKKERTAVCCALNQPGMT